MKMICSFAAALLLAASLTACGIGADASAAASPKGKHKAASSTALAANVQP